MPRVLQNAFVRNVPKLGMPWFILMLTVGCGQKLENIWTPIFSSESQPSVSPLDTVISKVESLAQIRSRCLASQGKWNSELFSCVCPPGQLFNVGKGCETIFFSPKALTCAGQFSRLSREKIKACVNDIFNIPSFSVHIDPKNLTDEELQHLTERLDEDATSILPGVSFLTEPAEKFINMNVQKLEVIS